MAGSPIKQKQIDRARGVLTETLTDIGTNLRTGEELPCRVAGERMRQMPIAGWPDVFRGRLWQILFSYNAVVEPADRINVVHTETDSLTGVVTTEDRGLYSVVGTASPASINIMTKVEAIHEQKPEIYAIPTDQVSFRQRRSQEDIGPISATIVPLDRMAVVNGGEWIFTHQILWRESAATVFSDGQSVSRGDQILVDWLQSGVADLDYPRRYPAIGYTIANFRDS